MSIRFPSIRAFGQAVCLLPAMMLTVAPSFSQQPTPVPPPASSAPASSVPAKPAASQTTAPASPAAATQTAPANAAKEPDYADPRSFTIGIFGLYSFATGVGGPDIKGGSPASVSNTYEDLYNIGQPYRVIPQFEFSIPITRTGILYAEIQRYHGWADQTLTRATYIDTYSYNPADTIHSTYHLITGRLYLDDLLYPHKFPVARLRFKSIWGLRYISVTQTVDSATEDATAGLGGSSFELGTNFIFFPEFGAAMEYSLTPHVVFRVEAAGFGFPHHGDVSDTGASLSYRKKNLEFLAGVKSLHFKTSPHKEEYEVGTFTTPFIGIRWHF